MILVKFETNFKICITITKLFNTNYEIFNIFFHEDHKST